MSPSRAILFLCILAHQNFLIYCESSSLSAYNHEYYLSSEFSDWMKNLSDRTPIHTLSLIGTHDTMALYGGIGAQAQSVPLMGQLLAGVRVLDIRCRRVQDKFAIHHGVIFQHVYFGDVLNNITQFLVDHPSETILMKIKEEVKAEKDSLEFWEIFVSYLTEERKEFFWNVTKPHPQLEEVRGKIVLIDAQTNWTSSTPETERISPHGLYYRNPNEWNRQDEYKLVTDFQLPKKWKLIEHQLEAANTQAFEEKEEWPFYMNYLSANSILTGVFPYFVAGGQTTTSTKSKHLVEGMNERTVKWVDKEQPKFVGIIMADFPGDLLIRKIISLNF